MMNKKLIISILLLFFQIQNTHAREPGVGHNFPPGLTHGIPTGALPPPGFSFLQRFGHISGDVVDDNGDNIGVSIDALVESSQIFWSTDWRFFGARYMTFFAVPYMMDLDVKTPGPNSSSSGLLNPVWRHIFSWDLGDGLHAALGIGTYFMIGDDDVAPQFDYTLDPEAQISYLSKDWNITGQVVFNINGENDDTDYESGDQIFLNFHAIKNFGKFGFGPVVNYSTQINSDQNNGRFYGGIASEDAEQLSAGGLFTYNVGTTMIRAYYTKAVHAKNTTEENNLWVHIEFPLN